MPTTSNQLILTFWLVRPEVDLHEIEEMRKLGVAGVYEPAFTSGEKRLMCMVSRFDKENPNARISAALYAIKNAKLVYGAMHPDSKIWGVECWLDGQKLSQNEIPQWATN